MLIELYQRCSQAIWLDDLSRDLLDSGRLDELIGMGLRGLTSNPAIFRNAIIGGAYDDYFADSRNRTEERLFALMASEVRRACQKFAKTYEATARQDGYVSLEVSPKLAQDIEGTLTQARHLVSLVGQPNLMIKVPATEAGLAAIEELIYEGINVNVTLIFSVEQYVKVAGSYKRGIARRVREGLSVDNIHSVASVFVSRIDSYIDKKVLDRQDIAGKVALANSHLCYAKFNELFPENYEGNKQRVLFASTSAKNPNFDKLIYFSNLLIPGTVNTLPSATLNLALELDVNTLSTHEVDGVHAAKIMESLGEDTAKEMFAELLSEGLELFDKAFDELVASIN